MGALSGRTAVVVGGSRGIGRGVVQALAADGAAVVFSYVSNEGAAREVESAVGAEGGSASAVQAELGQVDSVRGLFAQAEEALGGLDIVVLNAAVIVGAPSPRYRRPTTTG